MVAHNHSLPTVFQNLSKIKEATTFGCQKKHIIGKKCLFCLNSLDFTPYESKLRCFLHDLTQPYTTIGNKNKTETVQSKTARQVCDRKILFEYMTKFPKAL